MLSRFENIQLKNDQKRFFETYIRYAERMFVKKKTTLYLQGDIGNGFYYIMDGLIKISTIDFKENTRILDITSSGQIIGEQVLNEKPYFSTATVLKDSILYYFSIPTYYQLIQKHPEVKNYITNSIIDKVKLLLSDINVKSIPTENQVAYCLVKLLEIYNNVEIHLTQQELSDYTGLTRITIYKVLKKWEEDGLLQIKNRKIYILKPNMLKKYLEPY